jgi:hypothetical protein
MLRLPQIDIKSLASRVVQSNWFGYVLLGIASLAVLRLYLKGGGVYAAAGAILLAVAAFLIFWGGRRKRDKDDA